MVNVADRWPASAVELGALTSPRAVALAESLERLIYRHSAAITVPTDGLHRGLDALPSANGRVHRLGPSVDVELFDPEPPRPSGPLRVLYAGTIGMAQGLETLVEAARLAGPQQVALTIAGDGHDAPALAERIKRDRLDHVQMLGSVAHAKIPALYAETDIAVVLLRDRPIFEGALPTKLLEAMAAGRAIALSARGESADLVHEVGAGLAAPPEDPAALAALFTRLHEDPASVAELGRAGRAATLARFSRALVTEQWQELLGDLVARR